MSNVIPFPLWKRPTNPDGEIFICPSATDDGSWCIVHVLRQGDLDACVDLADGILSFDEATRVASDWAKRLRADFHPGGFAA